MIRFEVIEPERRPVSAVADHTETRRVAAVSVSMDYSIDLVMLHDPGHSLDERILREQFG
jgi:NAD+ kinase